MTGKSLTALHKVEYGRSCIEFLLRSSSRKTLAIHVHPDCSVEVVAPIGSPIEAVLAKVRKRGDWILTQLRRFDEYALALPPRKYRSGETHRYLGRQYRITVESAQGKPGVTLEKGRFRIRAGEPSTQRQRKRILESWFKAKAREIFQARLEISLVRFHPQDRISVPQLKLLPMKKRWGSCSHNGTIILNPQLMAAPRECIDYVITHELCHLLEPRHSPRFFRLLKRAMPDWEKRREKLNRTVEISW